MKFWAGVVFTLLVVSPRTEVVSTTEYQTIVRTVEVKPKWKPTPVLDSLIDVEEEDRQGHCLWYYMRENNIEITLWNVIVSGDYADMMGGACYLIGEDDEPLAQVYVEEPS